MQQKDSTTIGKKPALFIAKTDEINYNKRKCYQEVIL